MISARALGVYYYIKETDCKITAEHLADVFPEGRKVFLAALKELREAGLIKMSRAKMNKSYTTYQTLTDVELVLGVPKWESEKRSPKKELLSLQNSNKYLNANSYIKTINNTSAAPMEEYEKIDLEVKNMGYDFFESTSSSDLDEVTDAKRKQQKYKLEQYEEKAAKKVKKKFIDRWNIDKSAWSSSDIAFEFADRCSANWKLKPWAVTKTRFGQALADARGKHDTNGEIEFKMLDSFFASLNYDKHNDPEILWRMFIKNYSGLASQAKLAMVPVEESDEELRLKEKALSRLRGNV